MTCTDVFVCVCWSELPAGRASCDEVKDQIEYCIIIVTEIEKFPHPLHPPKLNINVHRSKQIPTTSESEHIFKPNNHSIVTCKQMLISVCLIRIR